MRKDEGEKEEGGKGRIGRIEAIKTKGQRADGVSLGKKCGKKRGRL